MKITNLSIALLIVSGFTASAQTKQSGTGKCGKPEKMEAVEVGDRTGHALAVMKNSCTWTAPLEMAGLKSKSYTAAISSERNGEKSQDRGYVVVVMENGDKAFVRVTGTGTSPKDGSTTGMGTWSYTGGTGKLKGLTGKGTYTSKGNAEGGEDQVEGEYAITPPAAPKAKKD